MLEHLITPENLIEVLEVQTDRDGDESAVFVVGTGYGVFRGQAMDEFVLGGDGTFSSVGTLLFYKAQHPEPITVNGRTYYPTKTEPYIKGSCRWRGITFVITGVDHRVDIDGNLVGYTIRCANG